MGDWVCGALRVCRVLRGMVFRTEVGTDTTLGPPEADWRQQQAPCFAVPGHWPSVSISGSLGHHCLSASSLCGPEHGGYMKAPNLGIQQPLATWENGPVSKDPCFISAFKIKILCASVNAGGICYSSGKTKRTWAFRAPILSLDAAVWGRGRGACPVHTLWPDLVAMLWAAASGVARFSEGTRDWRWIPACRKEDPRLLITLVSLLYVPSVFLSSGNSPTHMLCFGREGFQRAGCSTLSTDK